MTTTPVRTPLQDIESEEFRRAVLAALEKLPPRRREAFTLFYLRDLTYCEVAEVMGIQQQSVANHLQAALAELRSALGPFNADGRGSNDEKAAPRARLRTEALLTR